MKSIKPFYRISYTNSKGVVVALYGAVQASLFATINELNLAGINHFVVTLLSADEFNADDAAPYTIPLD